MKVMRSVFMRIAPVVMCSRFRVDHTVGRVSSVRFRNLQNRETLTLYAYAFNLEPPVRSLPCKAGHFEETP